ncbi:hypothetical protein HOY80DRAFT_958530 [Tuber brumale]|nr:hypothetical protein HOY80DRAFT_958530 [Tuber brumale]
MLVTRSSVLISFSFHFSSSALRSLLHSSFRSLTSCFVARSLSPSPLFSRSVYCINSASWMTIISKSLSSGSSSPSSVLGSCSVRCLSAPCWACFSFSFSSW